MILFLNIIFISFLAIWGWRVNKNSPLALFYWPGLILKIFAGILLGVLYREYLEFGDTWTMFSSAVELKNIAFSSWDKFIEIFLLNNYEAIPGFQYSWFPTAYFIKLLALLTLITGSNYWIASAYLSLLSFFGLWALSSAVYRYTQMVLIAVLPTLLFPSIVFWSSGVLKDSISMAALTWLLAIIIDFARTHKISKLNLAGLVVSFIILAVLKYYIAGAVFIAIVAGLVTFKITGPKEKWYRDLGLFTALFFGIGFAASFLHPNFWLSRIMDVVVANYHQYSLISSSDSMINFNGLENNIGSFLLHLPKAIFGGLYRPMWGGDNYLSWGAVLENWLLLLGTFWALLRIKIPAKREDRIMLWAGLFYVILTASLIALSSPNFGTLVRYKISYLIIFVYIIITAIVPPSAKRA